MPQLKIRKQTVPWKDKEHLFTPENICKLEQLCCKDCLYRKHYLKHKVHAVRSGPIIWVIKDGKPVDFTNLKKGEEKNGKS